MAEARDDHKVKSAPRRCMRYKIYEHHKVIREDGEWCLAEDVEELERELAEARAAAALHENAASHCAQMVVDALPSAVAPMFPVMFNVKDKPGPTRIPWFIADMAYSKYSAQHGKQQSLERMKERGGFWASEMDEFLPDWRERAEAWAKAPQSATGAWERVPKDSQLYSRVLEHVQTVSEGTRQVFLFTDKGEMWKLELPTLPSAATDSRSDHG